MRINSPLRYIGSKGWYINRFKPLRSTVVEPFAGSAAIAIDSVLSGACKDAVLIEIDDDIAAMWRTIFSPEAFALARKISTFDLTPQSAHAIINHDSGAEIDIAFRTILKSRLRRAGNLSPTASYITPGDSGEGLKTFWYVSALVKIILELHSRRDQFSFHQDSAFNWIADRGAHWFIDPPYVDVGNDLYTHYSIDHEKLFHLASKLTDPYEITYNDVPATRILAQKYGMVVHPMSMQSAHHETREEICLKPPNYPS